VGPQLTLDSQAELGEGPSWDSKNGVLYWVDIFRGQVHIYDPQKSKDTAVRAGEYVSCVVPRRSGGVAMTLRHGFYTLALEDGRVALIAEVEKDMAENRFNDGKCDPAGRLWAGTMDIEERAPRGALYCLEKGSRVLTVLKGTIVSNGLGWSPDWSTMYFIDSPTRKVFAFDYAIETGELKSRRIAVDFAGQPGEPDGMAVDEEGMIWVAHWGGWRITRFDPNTGRALERVSMPVSQVTSCCFGGNRLDRLYVTTARSGLSPDALSKEPLAGDLFEVQTGVKGLATNEFDG
jgi:sugar lactone lactonase YvrE